MSQKGLAWFAHQVPTEGFSDISEGRVGEKEIPHSDQWVEPPPKSDSYRPDRFNRKSVLKGLNKGGFPTTLIEELYQSSEYIINKAPHGATYEQGRYVFQYPTGWQNSSSVNKRVAVRRIETRPHDYFIDFKIGVLPNTGGVVHSFDIKIQIPSHYNIQQAGSAIKVCFETQLAAAYNSNVISFVYHSDSHSVDFGIRTAEFEPKTYSFGKGENDDILKLLNIENPDSFYGTHTALVHIPNVRSREQGDIFLHSSFVSGTTAGYLGREPEFYSKPNKMYADDGQNFFYIETSLDGYNRVNLPYENFIVELTYIIDNENYD
jgi:hypothetical protein